MQRQLARAGVVQGKLFLFAVPPGRIEQWVWWPYTKSPVVERPEWRYGPLAAVIAFDRSGVTRVSVRRDEASRQLARRWLARQSGAR